MTNKSDMGDLDGSGRIIKMETDCSSICDEKIPQCKDLAAKGRVHDALDQLLALEKQTRNGADMVSTSRVLIAVVQICYDSKDWVSLNDHISLLAKRRSQLKQAVVKMVQECCIYVDKMPTKETKIKLIETLRQVTEGKIYVEVERARLTHKLAKIKEEDGDVSEAAKIIQELQVETYGSMEKREKVELILEQMRLCLEIKDYVRTQIISKKISTKFFDDPNTEAMKEKFYRLMIAVNQQSSSYLAVCRHYRALGTCGGTDTLVGTVLYLLLSPYDNEQADLTHRIVADKQLEQLPVYKELLKMFMNPELIRWDNLCLIYMATLRATAVFDPLTEDGEKRWNDLRNRVVEHNIRIISMYYTRVTLTHLSKLLGLNMAEAEEFLCKLVVAGTVKAKTDRPAGIVHFSQNSDVSNCLNSWSNNLSELMDLINKTTHLINKEECIHKRLTDVEEEKVAG